MYYIVETAKSFEQAVTGFETAVERHGFGVLHIHDLGTTLRSKGIALDEQCKVFVKKIGSALDMGHIQKNLSTSHSN